MDPTPSTGGPAMDGALGELAMARMLAYLFLASATLALAGLAVPHGEAASVPGLLAVVAVGYVVGALVFARAPRLKAGTVPVLLAVATALVTAAVWFSGDADSAYGL